MTPTTYYPTNQITPHGAYYLLSGRIPEMRYLSYDQTSVFALMGGASIADPITPESVRLTSLRGLIPPWKEIAQKGATQDGASFVTALYDVMDVDMGVELVARDPFYLRRLENDWLAAWDAIQPGQLSFFTQELGYWWADVRWAKSPVDKIMCTNGCAQAFTWTARVHDAFWRTQPDACMFGPMQGSGTATGFLTRTNPGDQVMWDEYTCVGPGTFSFASKPGGTDMVSFGPLLANQVMMVRTDPGKRGVVDLTSIPPSPQDLNLWQWAIDALFSFFSNGLSEVPLFRAIESLFGIRPPQGNPYSLLHGRFSGGIPAKPAGAPPGTYHVACKIEGGAAGSMIIAGGIPLRRLPW